jgi:aminoglycoside phosphotransferase (APT) family kinase protein
MVMEFLPGRPFLGGITWYRFARDFPKMLRSWPAMFAETLALLVSADTAPVFETLARHGVSADAAATTRHLAWIDETLASGTGYEEAVRWLKTHQPSPPDRVCVVHGDLWPSNVFTSGKHITGLVDWTTAAVGDPALDVGFARVGLALMPEPFPPPPPIRNAIHAAGLRLAQQIQLRCAALVGGDDRIAYYEALRCMVQITVIYAERQRGSKSRWARGLPALIRHLNTVTGLKLPAA